MRLLPLVISLALAHIGDEGPAPGVETSGTSTPAPPKAEGEKPAWKVDDTHGPSHPVNVDTREGTWMSVSVHGDKVLFDLLGDIWSIPLAGGEATRVTSGNAWDAQPAFSPDGTRIAFVSDRGGNEQIWIMNADGSGARQFTDEAEARVTEPRWDGDWIVARRRTVDTRSIGVTELWQYHLEGGSGIQLTKLDNHPHAGEAVVAGRYLWYSDRSGRFEYNHDPLGGLWSVWKLDRVTGEEHPVVSGVGSASRPMLAPDQKSLVFVSRDRDRAQLEVLDLASGKRRILFTELDRDEMEGFAMHGTYPAMDWTSDGKLVLWAKGKLWKLGLDGTKTEIPFHAAGSWNFRDVHRWDRAIPDEVQAKVIRWPTFGPDGSVVFSAMGALWRQAPGAAIERLSPGTGYAPTWSADGTQLLWTSWSDTDGGRLHLTKMGKKRADEVLPVEGQLNNPSFGDDGRIVVLRGVGGQVSPDLNSEPYNEIVLLTKEKKGWSSKVVTTVGFASRAPRVYLHGGRIWYSESRAAEGRVPEKTVLVSVDLEGRDKRTHLVFDGAQEVAISPDFTRVAYKLDHQAHVTALPVWGAEVTVGGTLPDQQLTDVVGDWLAWTPDGKAVTWATGPILHRKAVQGVGAPQKDPVTGQLPEPDYKTGVEDIPVDLRVPRARPKGTTALTHARVLTMVGDEAIEDTTVVIEGDRITAIGGTPPAGATIIDCTGKTVIPGLIDVHAHLHYTAGDILPEQEWRYQTALDFGVTTVHDPSAATDLVFTQAERVEAGYEVGPRVYSTGYVLYGALASDGAKTPDPESARRHVERMKLVGAQSVKVYQQSQRERRQWYVDACDALQMLCVPEGGGDMFQNLGMVADGFHAIEHALPTSPLYQDVITWMAGGHTATSAGTAYSPTLLVAYGGLMGENWFYQYMNPIDDARLRRHFPPRLLDAQGWRRDILAQDTRWNFMNVAADAAKIQRAGGMVTLGAHGQLQGLGVHWELWGLAGPGAMTPMEALRAATISGATYLGLDKQLGTVEKGKLADLVVLDADPRADIHNSAKIAFTVKNGAVWK